MTTDGSHGPLQLADGSVVVPPRLAGAVRRILVRDLAEHIRADGGRPTAGLRQVLYAFARAEHQHDVAQAAAGSDDGTGIGVSPIVEISTSAAAAALGCSEEYVRRLCRSGGVSARRIGRAWLIDQTALDHYRHGRTK